MSVQSKLFAIFSVVFITLGYGLYEREKFSHLHGAGELILQYLPNFDAKAVGSERAINHENLIRQEDRAAMVHLWATWCGICKDGMPGLISFAERVEPLGIRLLLLAVNDDANEVDRYMSRFDLPSNVDVALEQSDNTLDRFGTVRVPETYLFSRDGKHLNKFVGSQDWSRNLGKMRSLFFG